MNDIVINSIIDSYKVVAESWKRMYEEKKEENEQLNSIIKEVRECVEHYAIENDDYTKLYSAEEQDILKLLDKES